jgi:hypothetical protein
MLSVNLYILHGIERSEWTQNILIFTSQISIFIKVEALSSLDSKIKFVGIVCNTAN